MPKTRWTKSLLLFTTLTVFFCYALETDAFARLGGGRSFGSRGSRTYSPPSRSYAPSSPSRPAQSPYSPAGPSQTGGGGFLRGIAGGIAGGLLGSMLFRGLGFGGGWGGGGGTGFFDIIIIALILYLIYRFVKRKRALAEQETYYRSSPAATEHAPMNYGQPETDYGQNPNMDVQGELRYITQMDPSFDANRFREAAIDMFFRVQGAWANRDMSPVKNFLTDEMYRTIESDAARLRQEGRINKLDNIAVRSSDIVEAWQEAGTDYITLKFLANVLDSTIDEKSGEVVSGSRSDPVKFEEYWTFTRRVGNNPWQLSAITQAG
jgi:predicted lipid-binding transport protein (Tim44 family)